MKVAYFCEPQLGGTYTFFRRMRPALATDGIELRCIPPYSAELFTDSEFRDDEGVEYVSFPQSDLAASTRVLIEHLKREAYDAVVVLPGSDTLCVNMIRYLPHGIRATARVPMFTRGSYAPASAISDHVNMLFAVCHRIADDLRDRYGVPDHKVEVIYNGIEVPSDIRPKTVSDESRPFRMVFTGRLVDSHKGITLLPLILRRLVDKGVDAQLTVVGDGPDAELLRHRIAMSGMQERIAMIGKVSLVEVRNFLQAADAYVLPTRYEGCPNALLEAMANGCAPVVSRLRGSTDIIIEDGRSGLLAEVGDTDSFVGHLYRLAQDRTACAEMGRMAHERIAKQFRIEQTAEFYANVLKRLPTMPDERAEALSLSRYNIPRTMRPTWRTRVPEPLKNRIREWLERIGVST